MSRALSDLLFHHRTVSLALGDWGDVTDCYFQKHGDEGMLGETTDKGEAPHWKKNASSSSSGDTTAQASSDKKESAIDKLKNTLNMK